MEPRTPVQLNMEELWKYPPFAGLEVKRLHCDEEEIWVITDTQGEPPMDWNYKHNETWNVIIKRNGHSAPDLRLPRRRRAKRIWHLN